MDETTIRSETEADITTIRSLITRAFADDYHSWHDEHDIVEKLRDAEQLPVSLVTVHGTDIVGYAAATDTIITDGTPDWYSIGPLAVEPTMRSQGIGTDLIRAVIERLRDLGARGIIVLGRTYFYQRLGFTEVDGLDYGGTAHGRLLAMPLSGPIPHGTVTLRPEID